MITYGHTGGTPPDQAYWDNLVTTALVTNGGRLVVVSNQTQFNTALADAQPDDVIRIANGSYTWTVSDVTSRSGTSGHPIILIPQTRRGVTFTSNNQFLKLIYCNYWIVGGFNFVTVPIHVFSLYGSSNNTFTDCKLTQCGGDVGDPFYKMCDLTYYGTTAASSNTYSWLELVNSHGFFRLVAENANAAVYRSINNTWKYITFNGWATGNRAPCIQLGAGSEMGGTGINNLYDSYSTVQYCYFYNVQTTYNEHVSCKLSRCTVEYNKFEDTGGLITFRLGDNSICRYNYRVDSVNQSDQLGLVWVISGQGHKVYGNIIDAKCGYGIIVWRGGSQDPNGHRVPQTKDIDVFHNTVKMSYGVGASAALRIGRKSAEYTSSTYVMSGIRVFYNIFTADSGRLFDYEAYGAADTSLSFGYNNFYLTGSAAYGTAYSLNANVVTGNPVLDADYYPSKTGAAYSAGISSSYSIDFYGNPRKSVPDLGAVETGGVFADQGLLRLVGGEVGVVAYDTTPYSIGPIAGIKFFVGGEVNCSARGLLAGPDKGILFLQGGPKEVADIGPSTGKLYLYGGLLSSEKYDWSAI